MKLEHAKSNVLTTNSLERRRATVDLNPTIAHVLSRDLYQKPIESMFREILINAIDAHRENGQTTPVEIHLPTAWDNTFYIRDFGSGLSHDKLMDIYLAYGVSTRRDTNEVHGGLGLGTKSPLAYTTSFAVTSWTNGQCNQYLVYYDEDNLPCVDYRESYGSDEPSGLKVSLTLIKISDYHAFRTAAINILPYIPENLYTIENNSVVRITSDELVLAQGTKYENVVVREGLQGLKVKMGFVAYKVDVEAVVNYFRNNSMHFSANGEIFTASSIISNLTRTSSVEIQAKIGDYPVHPSREYINITPRVMKNVQRDVQMFLDKFFEHEELDFASDLQKNLLVSEFYTGNKSKIRARIMDYTYHAVAISNLITSYDDLIKSAASYAKQHKYVVTYLNSNDFVDYLGANKGKYGRSWPYNAVNSDTVIIAIDKENTAPDIISALGKVKKADLSGYITEFRRNITEAVEEGAVWTRPKKSIIKSFQDPKHNVLFLKPDCSGQRKADWASAKHNVKTLKELDKLVYYIPTKMGCAAYSESLHRYNYMKKHLFSKDEVVIIGLPASKGTKQIEAAFKPVERLEDDFVIPFRDSPRVKRRVAFVELIADISIFQRTHNSLLSYGPYNYLRRLIKIGSKYRSFHDTYNSLFPHELAAIKQALTAKKAALKDIFEDIYTKFQVTSTNFRWSYGATFNEEKLKKWAEELTDMLEAYPTGAKQKKDPYNI